MNTSQLYQNIFHSEEIRMKKKKKVLIQNIP